MTQIKNTNFMQENTFAHHSEAMNFISLINAYLAFFILLVFIRHGQMQNGSLIFWDLACFYRGSSVFAHKQLCVHTTDSLVFICLVLTGIKQGVQRPNVA